MTLSVLAAGISSVNPALAQRTSDEAVVRGVFDTFQHGWNTPGFPDL
jgi:hypothetical protein